MYPIKIKALATPYLSLKIVGNPFYRVPRITADMLLKKIKEIYVLAQGMFCRFGNASLYMSLEKTS